MRGGNNLRKIFAGFAVLWDRRLACLVGEDGLNSELLPVELRK